MAIARAMVRYPVILLLDEATSGLDSENERMAQEVLEVAQECRISITIAHRLATIMEEDVIFVINNGSVVERETLREMLSLKGTCHKLNVYVPDVWIF